MGELAAARRRQQTTARRQCDELAARRHPRCSRPGRKTNGRSQRLRKLPWSGCPLLQRVAQPATWRKLIKAQAGCSMARASAPSCEAHGVMLRRGLSGGSGGGSPRPRVSPHCALPSRDERPGHAICRRPLLCAWHGCAAGCIPHTVHIHARNAPELTAPRLSWHGLAARSLLVPSTPKCDTQANTPPS